MNRLDASVVSAVGGAVRELRVEAWAAASTLVDCALTDAQLMDERGLSADMVQETKTRTVLEYLSRRGQ